MTDTLPVDEPSPARANSIPPYDPTVRYASAEWTDAHHIAVEAVRSDPGYEGVVELIAASTADWRWRLITEGDAEAGVSALDIRAPDLNIVKKEAKDAVVEHAEQAAQLPILYPPLMRWFPADPSAHARLLTLVAEIASYRKLGITHECTLIDCDGNPVRMPDDTARGKTPVVDISAAISTRNDRLVVLQNKYVRFIGAARSAMEVEALVRDFTAEVDALMGMR